MTPSIVYRLSIAQQLERFRPEIEYACEFLDRCHYVVRRVDAPVVLHYGPAPPPDAVAVPAALFPIGATIDQNGIHPDRAGLTALETGRGPASLLSSGQSVGQNGRTLGYDALGLIFFMLSRLEERDSPERDRYGRFPLRASLAGRCGITDPRADRAARHLASAITGADDPPSRTRYQVRLTHDVDRLRGYHKTAQPLRWALGDLVKRGRPRAALARLRESYLSGEPWRSVRWLMARSERRGWQSRFYLMGPTENPMDSPYGLTMPRLMRALADEVTTRGHVIGFHPGFDTSADEAEWQRQHAGLEEVIGREVREGRQHALQYDATVTPEIWARAGMDTDHTLAFPEASLFRSGTCRPFSAYSLVRRKRLPLTQIATPIMDFTLFGGKYRDLDEADALADCNRAINSCKAYGGTLVVLWHTGPVTCARARFYDRLLERL